MRIEMFATFPLRVPTMLSWLLLLLWSCLPTPGLAETLRLIENTKPPASLDPIRHYDTKTNSLLRQIYGTIIDKDTDGIPRPALAVAWELVNPTTWEITLREGILFHNGLELTADDVAFSLNRLLDPAADSPRKGNYDGIIQIVPVGKYRFRIITKNPDPLIPEKLFVFGGVICAADFQRLGPEEYFRHPVGAGPFRFHNLSANTLTLKSFSGYFGGPPPVDTISISFLLDHQQSLEKLFAGQADIIADVPHRYATRFLDTPGVRLVSRCSSQVVELFFNAQKGEIFNDTRLRQAMNYLTPFDRLFTEVGPDCRAKPGPAINFGHRLATFTTPYEAGFDPGLHPYRHDPEQGRRILAEAGGPPQKTIDFLALNLFAEEAQALASAWREFGIESRLTLMDRERAFRQYLIERKPENHFDLMLTNPVNHWGDASFLMELHVWPGHPICRYENPVATRLHEEIKKTYDITTRTLLQQKLQNVIYADPPAVFGYQYVQVYGVSQRVAGFELYPDLYLRLDKVRIEPGAS